MKGYELVADGLTKQLNGQVFFRFVEDLGIRRGGGSTSKPQRATSTDGGGDNGAAMQGMVLGSMLLSTAEASQSVESEGDDFTPVWVTGAIRTDGHGGILHGTTGA